jgi:hypothetical protein
MDKVSQPSQEVNPLTAIIAEANATGRMIARTTIHETDKGKLVIRADQRGYLLIEVWPKGFGPTTRLTIAYWDVRAGAWVLSTSQERTQEWMAEAAELLGEQVFPSEELPAPVSPIDQAAADFVAQAGTDYDGRVGRAVELAKSGHTRFPQYETYFNPAGASGFYQCACPDAANRNIRSFIGQTCKHSICLWLVNQVSLAAETVAVRKLSDRIELARQRETALPHYASRPGRMKDYLD